VLELGLDGKHAFIAGVGGGIGSACVRALAAAGASVTCFDLDTASAADAARSAGDRGLALSGDARRLDDVQHAVDAAIAQRGPIDIAVDVIGEARWGRTIELDDTAWDESFDLVLRHFFNLARAAGGHMAGRGSGAIVAIASVSGLRSAPLHGPYGAAKAVSCHSYARSRSSSQPITCASTPWRRAPCSQPRVAALMGEERQAESAASIPLGGSQRPMTSPTQSHSSRRISRPYITGQTIAVDGGATAQFPLSMRA